MTAASENMVDIVSPDETPHPQTVARYIVRDIPISGPDESAADARGRLMGQRYADASHVFVIDKDQKLLGVAKLTDLLAAPSSMIISALMFPANSHVVSPQTDRELAASLAIRADATSLAQTRYVSEEIEAILQRLIDKADGKLSRGRGNLIARARKLTGLGVDPRQSARLEAIDGDGDGDAAAADG